MISLHHFRANLNGGAFQEARFDALVPLYAPVPAAARPERRRLQGGSIAFLTALGSVSALLRSWHRATEARRARYCLMRLDDHLLADIGLSRSQVRSGRIIPRRWGQR